MINLDKAYREAAKWIIEMAKKSAEMNEKFWKGKEIIPAEKWHKKRDYPEENECLKYIPDIFQDRYHFLCRPDNEFQYKNRKRWEKDYFEFLDHKEDPEFGKYKCKTCPLNEFELSFGIKDILRRYLEKNLPTGTTIQLTYELINQIPSDNLKWAVPAGQVQKIFLGPNSRQFVIFGPQNTSDKSTTVQAKSILVSVSGLDTQTIEENSSVSISGTYVEIQANYPGGDSSLTGVFNLTK